MIKVIPGWGLVCFFTMLSDTVSSGGSPWIEWRTTQLYRKNQFSNANSPKDSISPPPTGCCHHSLQNPTATDLSKQSQSHRTRSQVILSPLGQWRCPAGLSSAPLRCNPLHVTRTTLRVMGALDCQSPKERRAMEMQQLPLVCAHEQLQQSRESNSS